MLSLKAVLVLVGAFNALDYFLTLRALNLGFEEANPIVAAIIGTPFFPVVKLVAVPLCLWLMWLLRRRTRPGVLRLVWVAFSVYVLLMLYHGLLVVMTI
ncbi:MAG: DUF5658 family protein [Bacillota bacterium]